MAENGAVSIALHTPRDGDSDEDNGTHKAASLEKAAIASAASGGGGDACGGTPASGSESAPRKKPRGRPPGSKNKPKPPVVITREDEAAMRSVVLELSSGSDVVACVSGFARHRGLGVSILTGSGAVTNVILRLPGSNSTLTFRGIFDILALSGTFLPNNTTAATHSSPSSSSPAVSSHFAISLAGSHGQVIGGVVAGKLVAAGPVTLLVASFSSPEFQKLPPPRGEIEEDAGALVAVEEAKQVLASEHESSSMEMAYNVSPVSPMDCEGPAGVQPWSAHFRQPLNHRRHY